MQQDTKNPHPLTRRRGTAIATDLEMGKTYYVTSYRGLIQIVSASNPDHPFPKGENSIPVLVLLRGGRIVTAERYQGHKGPNVIIEERRFDEREQEQIIRPFVERLLSEGKSFITQTDGEDDPCILLWSLFFRSSH
ncbi:MAG: hypothetical protein UU93_C0016G0004 [Candidatus Amesbacteria bacterium GW2011_GWA2_42_12]|uniref:Uncharacterized protein n=1 Tax=Candidatus Amesbacteria bacterium GW2011_GWA2_42_12 TaxID=1618356 RepID=A0A0G0Y4M3_9BACT|nr:MAG: hypothetical protein UU93_C0016G0004 [Candidatus Amesbacteria bacterium GW2011_GWA2_42_12]